MRSREYLDRIPPQFPAAGLGWERWAAGPPAGVLGSDTDAIHDVLSGLHSPGRAWGAWHGVDPTPQRIACAVCSPGASVPRMSDYADPRLQCLYVAQYLDQLFPNSSICIWKWLLLVWAMAVPVRLQYGTLVRTFTKQRHLPCTLRY